MQNYKYKYDLHVHTSPVSPCGDFTPEEVVNIYKSLGFSGFVITNHFSFLRSKTFESPEDYAKYFLDDYKKAKEYGDKKGIDVILGLEIHFPQNANDYLVYGIDESDICKIIDCARSDYETFYKEFKNEKNLIIQAHPFRKNCFLENTKLLDGIEIFNLHPGHNSAVGFAAKAAYENPHLLRIGGTDFHHEGHGGMCAVVAKEKITDSFALAEVLKSKDYIMDVWGNKIFPY